MPHVARQGHQLPLAVVAMLVVAVEALFGESQRRQDTQTRDLLLPHL